MTTTTKIVFEELPREIQDLAPVYVKEWVDIALKTGLMSADERAIVHENVLKLYEVGGCAAPKETHIVRSPLEMALLAGERAVWWDRKHALPAGAPDPVLDLEDPETKAAIKTEARQWSSVYQAGNMWPGVCCYVTYTRDACGLELPEHEKFVPWEALARVSGYRIVHEDFCIVSDRPLVLKTIEGEGGARVPHCDDGPTHLWDDGFAIYHLDGVAVPEKVVMAPETITLEDIKTEENAEVTRLLREAYGSSRYLVDIGAKVLDMDMIAVDSLVPEGVNISRALMEDHDENRYLVGSDGSTSRVYVMPVPKTAKTCTEAHNALSGLDESNCILEG